MPKNDFRSYQNAVNEYRQNDEELMHWRTKGSKNGVSTTPGYKAIGEKAKGLLNAAGQYIYDAGKSVGNAVSSVAKKAVSTLTPAQVKAQKSAAVKGAVLGAAATGATKKKDQHENRRTEYNKVHNTNELITNAEKAMGEKATAEERSAVRGLMSYANSKDTKEAAGISRTLDSDGDPATKEDYLKGERIGEKMGKNSEERKKQIEAKTDNLADAVNKLNKELVGVNPSFETKADEELTQRYMNKEPKTYTKRVEQAAKMKFDNDEPIADTFILAYAGENAFRKFVTEMAKPNMTYENAKAEIDKILQKALDGFVAEQQEYERSLEKK